MRSKIAVILAVGGFVSASYPALARQVVDRDAPWAQTHSVRGPKVQQDETQHWGKHHHHGIYLEGSDYEHAPREKYD